MSLTRIVSAAMVVGALGLGAAGPGGPVASADDYCPPWCGEDEGDRKGPDWKRGDWHKSPWWANNRHEWWDDRNGSPPWGWGPPPPHQWQGGPPRPFNYWGYDVNPVWDDGFRQWGFWLFGLWVPVFGIGAR